MDLSVVIPARNEEWLARTVADVAMAIRGRTEVVVVLDGAWSNPPLAQHPRVHVIKEPTPIGQRAATNLGIRLASGKLAMKLDGHCSVAAGFDIALIQAAKHLGPEVAQVPAQYNLHVFDWVCERGHREYQGPTPASGCRFTAVAGGPPCGAPVRKDVVWQRRRSRLTTSWRFDADLHFQYWGERQKQETAVIHDTMSCLGACWVVDRDYFLSIGGLDEAHGSWGQMGTEIACKYWLGGGRLVTNRATWFAHLFRTQGGDFTFPYPLSSTEQERAREHSRRLWIGGAWPGQARPLRWLLDKFWPVPGWTEEQRNALGSAADEQRGIGAGAGVAGGGEAAGGSPSRAGGRAKTAGVVYYTDGSAPRDVIGAAMAQLRAASRGLAIERIGAGEASRGLADRYVAGDRGPLTMFRQILAGLERLDTDFAFLAEHDVLYPAEHFEFRPPSADRYFYNTAWWKVDLPTGRAVTYDARQTSGLCANRRLLVAHYRRRVQLCEAGGFTRRMGFEPGTHRRAERVDDVGASSWSTGTPCLDIRHGANLTETRWSAERFRTKPTGWREAPAAPGWPYRPGGFREMLAFIAGGKLEVNAS